MDKKKMLVTIAGGIIGVFVIVLLAAYFAPNILADEHEAMITVKDNMTAREIGDELHNRDLLSHPAWFRVAASISGNGNQIKKGSYKIDSRMSMSELLSKLTSGKSEATKLVIPEGYTVQEIARELDRTRIVTAEEFLEAAKKTDQLYPYMNGNRDVVFPTEGFLFPDTYFIPADATADEIIKMMLDGFDHQMTASLKEKIAARNMSVYQFISLASLVEKEAKYDEDRKPIAAVFIRRLKINMPLQSDASISYAMGTHKVAYSIAETQYDSPYNTYKNAGLPPGPICNPGMACINAVADAPQTDQLFFVADKEGHNHFSKTYDEHLKNVEEHE